MKAETEAEIETNRKKMQAEIEKNKGQMQAKIEKVKADIRAEAERMEANMEAEMKANIGKIEDDMKANIKKMKDDMKAEAGKREAKIQLSTEKTEAEMKANIGKIEAEMKAEAERMEAEMKAEITEMEKKNWTRSFFMIVRLLFSIIIAQIVASIGLYKMLEKGTIIRRPDSLYTTGRIYILIHYILVYGCLMLAVPAAASITAMYIIPEFFYWLGSLPSIFFLIFWLLLAANLLRAFFDIADNSFQLKDLLKEAPVPGKEQQ